REETSRRVSVACQKTQMGRIVVLGPERSWGLVVVRYGTDQSEADRRNKPIQSGHRRAEARDQAQPYKVSGRRERREEPQRTSHPVGCARNQFEEVQCGARRRNRLNSQVIEQVSRCRLLARFGHPTMSAVRSQWDE